MGGGIEYALTNNFLARLEYRYTDLGSKSGVNVAVNDGDNVKFTSNAVLAGVVYKFGAP